MSAEAPSPGAKIADPIVSSAAAPFWEAAREERLVVRSCQSCGKAHYYPRSVCPHCGSADLIWRDASGLGEIYAFTRIGRQGEGYILAYVRLNEGVTMLTNIVETEGAKLAIGQIVEVCFRPTPGGWRIPFFRPHAA